ncbi:SDR family NAD(P)-dependent oxidoreductase [Gilvimarinus algae]|uniref:SDR family NAD(P)-dependent oxidoreductase n=1 Tax=Gilvimarinus algae TaxID=3058037 RepID=A0ABT8TF41_9GAMM|nr:SDR family NAD(P)-dependent oxidoreductase [Gilvimarinus sp. SDUM040014]MDO3382255.1 SDR family NAD(P)-dependent oxidoreductase [Gilvimarinus sp. SDUM040014]
MTLQNTTVLITGANRGLGKALVSAFLQADVERVYAASRHPDHLDNSDNRVTPVLLDVCDPASIQQLAERVTKLDVLINNAGVLTFGDILSDSEADLDHCLDVNLKGVWRLSRALLPALSSSHNGRICNILSLLSLASMPGLSAYNLSKAAAWSATLSLRASLQPRGIQVHGVFPGAIDTDMTASMDVDKAPPEAIAEDIIQGLLEGREDIYPGPAEEVYQLWRSDHKAVERLFAGV